MAKPRTARDGKGDWSLNSTTWTDIPHVRTIHFNPTTDSKEYASSSTGGSKQRLEGVDDFSGSMTVYIDPTARFDAASYGIRSGALGYIRAYEARTDTPFILPVYIDGVDYAVDVEDGNIIGATINFSANGPVTYPDGTP